MGYIIIFSDSAGQLYQSYVQRDHLESFINYAYGNFFEACGYSMERIKKRLIIIEVSDFNIIDFDIIPPSSSKLVIK